MSSLTFYEILELNTNCTNEDISNSYRRLSLKYHPKRNSTKDFAVNNFKFHQIAEAFTVLNSSILRGVYDIYGKEGLKNGILDVNGNIKGGFKYSGNAFELFEKYFATINPFALIKDGQIITDEYGSMFGNGFGGILDSHNEKIPDLEIDFYLDLEEVYTGGVKTLTYTRIVLNEDLRTTKESENEVSLEIIPGIAENSKLTFKGVGNEAPGKKTSDLIVTIKSKPHDQFRRVNSDLFLVYKLTLIEALNSVPLKITALDRRQLFVTMDEIISPQTVKKIDGEGLPVLEENKSRFFNKSASSLKKGDLYISFFITFPRYLTPDSKDQLVELLEDTM